MGMKEYRPLSMLQARLWLLQGASQAYYAQCAICLDGVLNMAALLCALQKIVERHEILRTALWQESAMTVPVQVISSHVEVSSPVIDLMHVSASSQDILPNIYLTSVLQAMANKDTSSPLLFYLVRFSSEKHLVLLCLSAFFADGYTLIQMTAELSQSYAFYLKGLKGANLTDEPLQYADVSDCQEEALASEEGSILRQYWRKFNLSQLGATQLPFGQKGPASCSGNEQFAPSLLVQPVEQHLADQIMLLAQRSAVLLDVLLLSCWEVLLWRLSGQQDLVIGLACNGRNYDDLTDALGLHSRFVPVETRLKEDLSFEQVIASVHESLLEATKRQAYFTWDAFSVCDPTSPSFFAACFEYERWLAPFMAENLLFSLHQRSCCTEPFALKLTVFQVAKRLHLEWQYDPQSVHIADVHRLAKLLSSLLESVLAQPQILLGQLPPLISEW